MIHIIAIITAKPGQRETILEAFRANIPAVHAAEGAGRFQTKFGEDTFLVIEKWESLTHLAAHASSPHMAAYGAKTKDMIASRVIHVLSPAT